MVHASNRVTHGIGAIVSAAGFALIGFQVVRLWLDPTAWGDLRWVGYMPQLLMAEFALLVITAIAAGLCWRIRGLPYRVLISATLLGVFFGPTIYVARMLGDDPLAEYLLVLIGARFLVLVGSSASGFEDLLGHTAVATCVLLLVLLGMLLVTALLPMPAGGIDAGLLRELVPTDAETGWEREPQRAFATVVVYCGVMVGVELLLIGPAGARTTPGRRRAGALD